MADKCKWCGMPKNDHIEAWSCGSIPGWDETKPIQSIACVEIARLKAGNEKLERIIETEGDQLRSAAYHTYRRWKSGEDLTSNLMLDILYKSLEDWALAMNDLEAPDGPLP